MVEKAMRRYAIHIKIYMHISDLEVLKNVFIIHDFFLLTYC